MFFGLSTVLYYKYNEITKAHIDSIRESGISLLEIAPFQSVSDEVLSYIKASGMKIYSVHADYMHGDLSSFDEGFRLRSIKNIKSEIQKAKKFGAEIIIAHPGKWTPRRSERKKRLSISIRSLIEVVGFAAENNIKVAVENLPVEFLCDNFSELNYVFRNVRDFFLKKEDHQGASSIGICIDTGHAFLTDSINEFITGFGTDILSMHVHDNKGDNGNDRSIGRDDLHYAPGFGKIDWNAFFNGLREIDYKKPLMFEVMSVNGNSESSEEILEKLRLFRTEKLLSI